MIIYAKPDADGGGIVRYHSIEEVYRRDGAPNAGSYDPSNNVLIDFGTNPAVLAQMGADIDEFTVISGQLRRNGTPVTFAVSGDRTSFVQSVRELPDSKVAIIRTGAKDFAVAISTGGTPTQEQRDRALAYSLYLHLRDDSTN